MIGSCQEWSLDHRSRDIKEGIRDKIPSISIYFLYRRGWPQNHQFHRCFVPKRRLLQLHLRFSSESSLPCHRGLLVLPFVAFVPIRMVSYPQNLCTFTVFFCGYLQDLANLVFQTYKLLLCLRQTKTEAGNVFHPLPSTKNRQWNLVIYLDRETSISDETWNGDLQKIRISTKYT